VRTQFWRIRGQPDGSTHRTRPVESAQRPAQDFHMVEIEGIGIDHGAPIERRVGRECRFYVGCFAWRISLEPRYFGLQVRDCLSNERRCR
jgi:hypothetical protein